MSENDWETLANAIDLLQPFEELTKDLSSQYYPSISKCIPSIVLLNRWLRNTYQNVHIDCLKVLISDLLIGIKARFEDDQKIWHSTSHLIGTYLDPRYKKLIEQLFYVNFNNEIFRFKKMDIYFNSTVASEVEKRTRNHMVFTSDERGKTSGQSTAPSIQTTSSIWNGHDEAVSVSNSKITAKGPSREANRIIMTEEYNILPMLPRESDPLTFWREKQEEGHFLPMVKVVIKFLCIPATSVPSEQLFSSAGELISESRNRLHPDNVDMILFLNKNA